MTNVGDFANITLINHLIMFSIKPHIFYKTLSGTHDLRYHITAHVIGYVLYNKDALFLLCMLA